VPDPLRFGANYVPSSGWFHGWLDYDGESARRDLDDLASLGLDHVRVFPIWPWIQPNRGLIRASAIDDLLDLIDAAARGGLSVNVDLVQGHLSSFDFVPSWLRTNHRASIFEDRRARDGIATYVAAVTAAVASRPNVFAVTLGNEVNNLWPEDSATPAATHDWAAELIEVVRANAPDVMAIYSLYDLAWYGADHPFHPADVVDLGDVSSVHSWVFNGTSAIDGPLGPATVTHADYLVELAAGLAGDPDRPVWLQEVGAPGPDIPAGLAAEFTRAMLTTVLANPALWGVTWWCSHDVDRSLLDFPDREYDLGLFTVDHRRKPAADALAGVIDEVRRLGVPADDRPVITLAWPFDLRAEPGRRAEIAPGSDFHRAWVEARATGPVRIGPG